MNKNKISSDYISELSCLVTEIAKYFDNDMDIQSVKRKYKIVKETYPSIIISKSGVLLLKYEKTIADAKKNGVKLDINFKEAYAMAGNNSDNDVLVESIFKKIQDYVNASKDNVKYYDTLLKMCDMYRLYIS
jgi:hypothetical protein